MKSGIKQKELTKHLRSLIPLAPMAEFHSIKGIAAAGHLRHLPVSIAAWQAVTTRARHAHTEYDTLLEEGYDQDSARHFVLDEINEVLSIWGCARQLDVNEK